MFARDNAFVSCRQLFVQGLPVMALSVAMVSGLSPAMG